jgi:hypothetical protein
MLRVLLMAAALAPVDVAPPIDQVDAPDAAAEVTKVAPVSARSSDPNYSRLMFAPTGRPLRKGDGYFSDYELVFPGFAVGLTDNVSLAGGVSTIPGLGLTEQLFYVSPKVGWNLSDRAAVAVGALFATAGADDDLGSLGIAFGVGTFGGRDNSFSVGLGLARELGDSCAETEPILMLGGQVRLSDSIALVSENWLILDGHFRMSDQPFGLALRFFGDRLSADVGVILVGELLEEGQRAGRVAVDDEVAEPEERFLLDRAQELEHGLDGDLVLGRRGELVERRDRVAEAAAGRAGDERQRRFRGFDAFALGDALQEPHELRQARPRQDERLAPRADGREHFREVRRAKDEDQVRRRLLDQLQEGVERGVRELVRLVEDVDLVAPFRGLEHDALADLADVVDPALGGGVHLDDVERRAVGDRDACMAGAVGVGRRPVRAVQRLGEDARERRLPGPARPGKEVGLTHLPGRDRVAQCAHDGLLPDDVVEPLRSVLPVERSHRF